MGGWVAGLLKTKTKPSPQLRLELKLRLGFAIPLTGVGKIMLVTSILISSFKKFIMQKISCSSLHQFILFGLALVCLTLNC